MAQRPRFGGDDAPPPPPDATIVRHDRIGRVTHVDTEQLAEVAARIGTTIVLTAAPGSAIDPARPVAWVAAPLDGSDACCIRDAFTVADQRAFDHDPRFGLVVLSEIAARALSPAVNDPGTAIAVIDAGTRVLAAMLRHAPDPAAASPAGVRMPPLVFRDLLADLYRPIARDGAGTIEVGLRLQKSLTTLQAMAPDARPGCARQAKDALDRATEALASASDRHDLKAAYEKDWRAS